jgi:hypothetical protein
MIHSAKQNGLRVFQTLCYATLHGSKHQISNFIVHHSRPNFALGTLQPAIQAPNSGCFVFTSDVFLLTCRHTVKDSGQATSVATKTNTSYIHTPVNHLKCRFAHRVPFALCTSSRRRRNPWAIKRHRMENLYRKATSNCIEMLT